MGWGTPLFPLHKHLGRHIEKHRQLLVGQVQLDTPRAASRHPWFPYRLGSQAMSLRPTVWRPPVGCHGVLLPRPAESHGAVTRISDLIICSDTTNTRDDGSTCCGSGLLVRASVSEAR